MTAQATLSQLKALSRVDGLSRRAADRIARLIDRLEAPVRVGVFGLPGAGKAAIVNALAGAEILRPGAQSVPVLLRRATEPAARLTLAGGETATVPLDLPFVAPPGVLFADIAVSHPALERMSVLNVAAEAAPRDMMAAMAWAAQRCDIALWCTRAWDAAERRIWEAGPDALKHHALLVATAGEEVLDRARAGGSFQGYETCVVPADGRADAPCPAQVETLRRRLADMIDTARAADLDVAAFLLEQHAPDVPLPAMEARPELVSERARPEPAAIATPSPSVHAALSRMVWQMRHAARDLARGLPRHGLTEDDATRVLARLQASFDALLDLADADDAFADAFPALHAELINAQELVQLLKIEGQPRQATEGLMLLSQMRREVCHALAA